MSLWQMLCDLLHPPIAREPLQKMTRGAKQYLLAKFAMLVIYGGLVVFWSSLFTSDVYNGHLLLLPLDHWGWCLIGAGLMCAYASYRATPLFARFALACSCVMTAVWASGFLVSVVVLHDDDAVKSLPCI